MISRSVRRHAVSRAMTALVALLSFTAVLALVLILGDLIAKGASSIDWIGRCLPGSIRGIAHSLTGAPTRVS